MACHSLRLTAVANVFHEVLEGAEPAVREVALTAWGGLAVGVFLRATEEDLLARPRMQSLKESHEQTEYLIWLRAKALLRSIRRTGQTSMPGKVHVGIIICCILVCRGNRLVCPWFALFHCDCCRARARFHAWPHWA
jgi:hypothetical protein